MNYKNAFYALLIIDFLLLTLLGAISFRFLSEQIRKPKETNPEIMAQYEINLDVDQFYNLVKQIKGE